MDPDKLLPCQTWSALICVHRRSNRVPHPFRDVYARNDGIAQRNAVAVMPGEKQAGRGGFEVVQRLPVFAVADVVLRDRARLHRRLREHGFSLHTEQPAQIRQRQLNQFFRRQQTEFGIPRATNVTGQREMAGRRTIGE